MHDVFVRIVSPIIKHMNVSREANFCVANDFAIAISQNIIARSKYRNCTTTYIATTTKEYSRSL